MEIRNAILYKDALAALSEVPSNRVHCIVTSPPYWGLRDYGTRMWFDADSKCEHDYTIQHGSHHPGQVEETKWKTAEAAGKGQTAVTHSCSKCGGWYGQLGLEPESSKYVDHLVKIFEELHRVLHPTGTCWLNIGDTYYSKRHHHEKSLAGIPWRVVFALQDQGWIIRSEVVWHKTNAKPESVKDRPTRSHEKVFLLSKSAQYFYQYDTLLGENSQNNRRCRDVWSFPYQPSREGHYAVFPKEIPYRCILSSTSSGGCCSICFGPFVFNDSSWQPSCNCGGPAIPCLVLDPFAGSGTTLHMAAALRRDFLGFEPNQQDFEDILCRSTAQTYLPKDDETETWDFNK